jgi:hypothetical protein
MGSPDTTNSQTPARSGAKSREDGSAEATTDKTLSDLEETEATFDSKSPEPSDVPSPDGNPTPERPGTADGTDTGGPM